MGAPFAHYPGNLGRSMRPALRALCCTRRYPFPGDLTEPIQRARLTGRALVVGEYGGSQIIATTDETASSGTERFA